MSSSPSKKARVRFIGKVISIGILVLGGIDVLSKYIDHLLHPWWSAAHYIVLFFFIPYLILAGLIWGITAIIARLVHD